MVRCNQLSGLHQSKILLLAQIALNRLKCGLNPRKPKHKPNFKTQALLPTVWLIFVFSATRLSLNSNVLEEECSEAKPNQQQKKKPLEEPKPEDIPLKKKKKKKRKLGQTVESPGNR